MEGVQSLVNLLRDWNIQLIKIIQNVGLLEVAMKDLREKILYALSEIGVLAKSSKLEGGQSIDSTKIINSVKKFTIWEEGVYVALQEVETAWPFIIANIQLLKEFTESANLEIAKAEKLAEPVLIEIKNNVEVEQLHKEKLSAFNREMAIVYSKIGVLSEVTKDIIGDMTNTVKLFEEVRKLNRNKKIRANVKESISRNIDAFLHSSVQLTQLFVNILEIVKEMKRPNLISDKILRKHAD